MLDSGRISPNRVRLSDLRDEQPELLLDRLVELDGAADGVDEEIDRPPEEEARASEELLSAAGAADIRVVSQAIAHRYPSLEGVFERYPSDRRDRLVTRLEIQAMRRRMAE